MMSGAGRSGGDTRKCLCGTVVACTDRGGRGSLAKNSSCLIHLFSGKTFVRKMVLFLAKNLKNGEKIVNHEKLKSIYN